jgi:hypothetical protein
MSGYVCEVTRNGDCTMPNPTLLSTSVDIFCLSSEKQVKEYGRREPRFADTTMLKCSLWFYIIGQSFDLQIVHI